MKLNSYMEKPWYIQAAILAVIALVVWFAFNYMVTSGIRAETVTMQEQVDKLTQDNARAQIAAQHINEFRQNYALRQAEYEDLKALLPEQREITTILAGLQDRARGRMSLRRFSPKEDVQQDFYMGKPIEVEVTGTYNNLGAFFADLAAYQRIVSISDFRINQSPEQYGGRSIDAQFLLTAYYVSPEKLATTAPGTPAAPGAAPAAPAGAPPVAPAGTKPPTY